MTEASVPMEVRKACLILGISAAGLTREQILETWQARVDSSAQARLEGELESVLYLRVARDRLLQWLDTGK